MGCGSTPHTDAAGPAHTPSGTLSASSNATSSPTPAVLAIGVGQSGVYTAQDSATEVKTQMQVTVISARYVTSAQIGTSNKPRGQYLDLKLTVKNVGTAPGGFAAYGAVKWEDANTASQDASTLEGAGDEPDLDTTYKPGQGVTGDVILDVLHEGGTLSYWDNLFSAGPSFTIKLPSA